MRLNPRKERRGRERVRKREREREREREWHIPQFPRCDQFSSTLECRMDTLRGATLSGGSPVEKIMKYVMLPLVGGKKG